MENESKTNTLKRILKIVVRILIVIIISSWVIEGIIIGAKYIDKRIKYAEGKETFEIISLTSKKIEDIINQENIMYEYEYKNEVNEGVEGFGYGGGYYNLDNKSNERFSYTYEKGKREENLEYIRRFYYKDKKCKSEFEFSESKIITYNKIPEKEGEGEKIIIDELNKEIRHVNIYSEDKIINLIPLQFINRWLTAGQAECASLEVKTENYKGKECYVIKDKTADSLEVWINKETNLIEKELVKSEYYTESYENIKIGLGRLTDKDLKISNIQDYKVEEEAKRIIEEYSK